MWYKECVKCKDNRVVMKLKNQNGDFKKSVIIPTAYYPLNGNYEVFHFENTERVLDENILALFDKVKYKIGHCYQNTDKLVKLLRENGYDAKSYVGWLFTSKTEFPIHHCWAVLDNSILDLADDFSVMLSGENGEHFKKAKNAEEQKELIVSFAEAASKVKNTERCYPVGKATEFLFYVGCECNPDNGRCIYNNLIREYPNHEAQRNCDSSGYNAVQRKLKEHGLMK